jgi:SAM-dependent methyltransferase
MPLHWKVDECSAYFDRLRIRGWCFHTTSPIVGVEAIFPEPPTVVILASFGQESPDVAVSVDPRATHCRFDELLALPAEAIGRDFNLRFTFADKTIVKSDSVLENACSGDRYFACWVHFVEMLRKLDSGEILEIGSRARSAINFRSFVPTTLRYVGLDILKGPNVDIVGDAHELEKLFGRHRFVASFSWSVFEHLAMPWKVALELNRVLKPGGIVYNATHQTWPLHEEPWDFWRFSQHSWQAIFNAATGFELIEAACGEPARIHPIRSNPATRSVPGEPAFLGSASIVRKISETELSWPQRFE